MRSRSSSDLGPGAQRRVWLAGLAAALVAAGLVLLAGDRLSRPLFDVWQALSPVPPASRQVAVVAIDADSLKAIGGWPWSRFYMARLVDEIAGRGASAIGLDILMPEPDRLDPPRFAQLYSELSPAAAAEVRALPSMDAQFSHEIGRSPVVLARAGALAQSFDALDQSAAPLPPEAQFSQPLPSGLKRYPLAITNLPLLDGAALGHGLVNGDPDGDGIVRRVPMVALVAGAPTPGLATELVRVAKGVDRIELTSAGGRLRAVQIGDRRLPASSAGALILRFGDWRAIPTTSAADLFRKGLPADLFKGKIVLVGLTAAGSSDVVNTPLAREPGVYVQAQAAGDILRGVGLSRPAWAPWAEWGVGLWLVLAVGAAIWRAPMSWVVVGGLMAAGAVVGASWWGFQSGWLLDPGPALAPPVACLAATVAALFVEGRAVQARLRAALESERLDAARVAGELSAAADIQSGMLLPRAELASLTAAADIDAVLHPARSVGGDLYDAFMLGGDRLCFMIGDVTGKGVPAALFMALAKSLARSLITRTDLDLTHAVARINTELAQDNRQDMALTLLVGVLHTATGRVDLVCAGHENPLVASRRGQVREIMLQGGPPLCVAPDFPYEVEGFDLQPDETLLAFTDGLTEAQDPHGVLWPHEAQLAAVARAAQAPTAAAMVDEVGLAVRAFEAGGEPSDDLTILAVRLVRS
ncbi:MAG TPA: CHASE2 domain-containing protein [Caulobacteraceae bacterium]